MFVCPHKFLSPFQAQNVEDGMLAIHIDSFVYVFLQMFKFFLFFLF